VQYFEFRDGLNSCSIAGKLYEPSKGKVLFNLLTDSSNLMQYKVKEHTALSLSLNSKF
jgi:hypothetical protein